MQKNIEKGNYLLCDKCGHEKERLDLVIFDGIIIFICEGCLGPNKKKI